MLEGICPRCGVRYYGWALRFPRNQSCSSCGTALEITEEGHDTFQGYSPFTAEEYFINLPTNAPHSHDKVKEQ